MLNHVLPDGRNGSAEIPADDFKLVQKCMRRLHGVKDVTLKLITSTNAAIVVKGYVFLSSSKINLKILPPREKYRIFFSIYHMTEYLTNLIPF